MNEGGLKNEDILHEKKIRYLRFLVFQFKIMYAIYSSTTLKDKIENKGLKFKSFCTSC